MEERIYTLELTSRQVSTLRRACEILSRLHMLQFDMVLEEVMYSKQCYDRIKKHHGTDGMHSIFRLIKDTGNFLKSLLSPDLDRNAYYGIRNENTSEDTEIAYDIQQVLRHCQSWEEVPPEKDYKGFLGVSYDSPMKFGTEPLPKISVKKVVKEDPKPVKKKKKALKND